VLAVNISESVRIMDPILELKDVCKYFPISSGGILRRRWKMLKAIDGITFSIERASSFAIAGESGSGKSTAAKLILLIENLTHGSIQFEGRNVEQFGKKDVLWYRTRLQTVFQDAAASLSPRMRIKEIVAEPLEVQKRGLSKNELEEKTKDILRLVGLSASHVMNNFPHELSGGQKQRVAIARALILNPSFIVLDEPVSSLDVSIRAQILNLLADLQEKLGLTYLMIAHDLSTLKHVCDVIAIMYLGKIMEMGDTEEIYRNPLHPYTRALFAAMPRPEPGRIKEEPCVLGEIGSPLDLPSGCRFHPRCELVDQKCREQEPPMVEVASNHQVACYKWSI